MFFSACSSSIHIKVMPFEIVEGHEVDITDVDLALYAGHDESVSFEDPHGQYRVKILKNRNVFSILYRPGYISGRYVLTLKKDGYKERQVSVTYSEMIELLKKNRAYMPFVDTKVPVRVLMERL
jgi:hypothetical protein